MLALLTLARSVAGFGGKSLVKRAAVATGLGAGGSFLGSRLLGGDDDRPRRRRRKRILTQSDRADIAFIKATVGGPAARDFASIVAARA